MKLALISDNHGYFPDIHDVDIVVFAGDFNFCERMNIQQELDFWHNHMSVYLTYLSGLDIKIVGCPGNHDALAQDYSTSYQMSRYFDCYDRDGIQEFAGFTWCLYGYCKLEEWAMFLPDEKHTQKCNFLALRAKVKPVDFLITHYPPMNHLSKSNWGLQQVEDLCLELKPKLHIFGHVHEGYGMKIVDGIKMCNVSYVDEKYQPRNQYIVYDTETEKCDIVKCSNLDF